LKLVQLSDDGTVRHVDVDVVDVVDLTEEWTSRHLDVIGRHLNTVRTCSDVTSSPT